MTLLTKTHAKVFAALLASSAGCIPAIAAAQEVTFEVVGAWESEYVFRGTQLQQNSFQPSAQININQIYFGAWSALPLEHNAVYDSEIDLYGGYGVSVNEKTDLDFGFTYYTYPELSAFIGGSNNTFETFAGISFDTALSPSLYAFYDLDLKTVTIEASLSHSWDLLKGYSLDVGSTVGGIYSNGAKGFSYYGAKVDISHEITEKVSGAIGLRWNGASENTFFNQSLNGIPNRFVDNSVSLGFSLSIAR